MISSKRGRPFSAVRRIVATAFALAFLLSAAKGASAQEVRDGGWEFYVTPYIWATGLSGTISTANPERPAETGTANFGQVLSHLSNVPVMVTLEADHGRWSFLSDLIAVSLRTGVSTPGPYFSGATASTTQFVTTEMAMYRVLQQRKQWLDLGIGVRTVAMWSKISFNSGIVPGFTAGNSPAWADPLFGVRYHLNLTQRIGLTAYGDVGDTGASTLTWQALGMADYRVNKWLMLHAGYRHLHINWSSSKLNVSTAVSGPFLAATIKF